MLRQTLAGLCSELPFSNEWKQRYIYVQQCRHWEVASGTDFRTVEPETGLHILNKSNLVKAQERW